MPLRVLPGIGTVVAAELRASPWRPPAVAAVATPALVAAAPWFVPDLVDVQFQALRLGALILAIGAAAGFGDEAVTTCSTAPTGRAIRWAIRTAALTGAAIGGWLAGAWIAGPQPGTAISQRLLIELGPFISAGIAGGMVAARAGGGKHSEAGSALPLGIFVTSAFLPPPWAPVLGPGSEGATSRAALVMAACVALSLIACSERAWIHQVIQQTRSI